MHRPSCHPINDTREASQLSDLSPHRGAPLTLIVAIVALAFRLSIQCRVMPTYPKLPNAGDFVDDVVAAAAMDEALKLRATHAAAPPLDILDLVLRGRRARALNFGDISPISAFDLLVVEVFDRGMPVSDWIGLYRHPDPRVIAALDDIWRKEVWPAFTAHFGIA